MLGMVEWTDESGRRETDGKGEQSTAVQTPGTSPDGAADHGAGIVPSTGRIQTSNTGLRILPRDKIRGTGNRRKRLKNKKLLLIRIIIKMWSSGALGRPELGFQCCAHKICKHK